MHISLIWAMSENRVIGRDNTLPWRLPDDMRHFMNTTMGKPVLMGRKTMESMKAPLPGRTNIVLTRNEDWQREGVEVVHTYRAGIERARERCKQDGQDEMFVVGGEALYTLGLMVATRLYITHVHAQVEGDVFFPEFEMSLWRAISEQHHEADERHQHAFTIACYERV